VKTKDLTVTLVLICSQLIHAAEAQEDPSHTSDLADFQETWWIIADTHIGSQRRGEGDPLGNLKAAVADANELGLSQKAIVLGDLVHDDPEFVEPYENAMNGLNHEWVDVLGNHDFDRRGTGKRVKERTFFSKDIAGVRVIALSDDGKWVDGEVVEGYQAETNLMADQNDWFRSELDSDPRKPTILWSHQGLRRMYKNPNDDGPCFWDPARRGWLRENWNDYNIIMWVHGHRHEWTLQEDYRGWGFVDVSPGAMGSPIGGGVYMTFSRRDDVTTITLRFRDHNRREWISVDGHEEYVMTVATGTR
jgi:hypothetical protein